MNNIILYSIGAIILAILGILVGLAQSLCTILFGFIIAKIEGAVYFSFARCLLLILTQMPILIFFVFLHIKIKLLQNSDTFCEKKQLCIVILLCQ